jgi:N-[(2S)-2-amino-2-carboxyethyl]-L-glutamate dehydrogenase
VSNRDLRILKGHDVQMILEGAELVLLDVVQAAYEAHSLGQSTLPHSSFLRFPNDPINRIIALPAFLSGDFELAGIKWIASFPDNVEKGLARASAVVVLNSARTGRPEAILEGSQISAQRTAASAALAARTLHADSAPTVVGLIGGGLINFETLRFLKAVYPGLSQVLLFDTSAEHALRFKERCMDSLGLPDVRIVASISDVLAGAALVACATTAVEPHIHDISMCPQGSSRARVISSAVPWPMSPAGERRRGRMAGGPRSSVHLAWGSWTWRSATGWSSKRRSVLWARSSRISYLRSARRRQPGPGQEPGQCCVA